MDSANTGMVMYDPKFSHCSGKKKATAMYKAADRGARQAKPRRRLYGSMNSSSAMKISVANTTRAGPPMLMLCRYQSTKASISIASREQSERV